MKLRPVPFTRASLTRGLQANHSLRGGFVFWFCLVGAVFLSLSPLAQATILLDTTGVTNQSATYVSGYADTNALGGSQFGTLFKTGSSSVTLSSVLFMIDGSYATGIDGTSDPLKVALYSNDSSSSYFVEALAVTPYGKVDATAVNHPGSQIGSFFSAVTSANPNPGSPSAFVWNAPVSTTLTPNTSYWLVLSSTDANDAYAPLVYGDPAGTAPTYTANLGFTLPTGSPTSASSTDSALFTASGLYDNAFTGVNAPANSWLSFPNQPLIFTLNGTLAGAPEPSKTLLLVLGCTGFWLRRRRF